MSLTIDVIGDCRRYISTDATTVRNVADDADIPAQIGGDESAVFGENTLVWHIAESKMYRITNADNDYKIDADGDLYDDTNTVKVVVTDVAEYVIGRYPNSWYGRLDSGLSLGVNVLLVDDQGNDLVPNSSTSYFKVTDKAVNTDVSAIYYSNGNFGSLSKIINSITNKVYWNAMATNQVSLINYTSYNAPTVQSDPKQIIQAPTKVIGTSSHSPYQGCMLTAAATGKVATNDGKGLVSKVVEDCEVDENGSIQTIPQHGTIDLSSSNSAASKSLISLGEDNGEIVVQVMSEELVWDMDVDNNNILTYAAGDSSSTQHAGYIVVLSGFNNDALNGKVLQRVDGGTTLGEWGADMFDSVYQDSAGVYRETSDGSPAFIQLWDGNGFGCFGDFQTLTNSTSTDMNGNTVRNYCGIKRLNMYS